MSALRWMRVLFGLAAVYDGVLGFVFLIAPAWVFEQVGVPPPNHWGYVRFPAALLLVFGAMFAAIARDPLSRRELIPYGIGQKAAYCGVTLGYWATSALPGMWKPFALIDLVMGVLFAWAWIALGRAGRAAAEVR